MTPVLVTACLGKPMWQLRKADDSTQKNGAALTSCAKSTKKEEIRGTNYNRIMQNLIVAMQYSASRSMQRVRMLLCTSR
jgi:hypothetical protein